jgi:uncharacterized protein (TIGR02117 family)
MQAYFSSLFLSLLLILSGLSSCSGGEIHNSDRSKSTEQNQYQIYIINYSYHTGIVIPVNSESISAVDALSYFHNYTFADIGWGEEKFYQDPVDNYCMAAKAILLPNRSVLRVEGYTSGDFISWSRYVVLINLDRIQYIKLLYFINESFTRQNGEELLIASKSRSEDIIFFKSIYRYHLFNTCNTWIAEALQRSGLDVSPFFIITARQLFDKIKDKGTVLKGGK